MQYIISFQHFRDCRLQHAYPEGNHAAGNCARLLLNLAPIAFVFVDVHEDASLLNADPMGRAALKTNKVLHSLEHGLCIQKGKYMVDFAIFWPKLIYYGYHIGGPGRASTRPAATNVLYQVWDSLDFRCRLHEPRENLGYAKPKPSPLTTTFFF